MSRIAIVGGGITGLSAAWRATGHGHDVVVFESSDRFGGKIDATPFGGLDSVDTGPDAFLARVPQGTALAAELGLGSDDLTSPATGSAFVTHAGRLHAIPAGLILGVPAGMSGLVRSNLLSWPGKLRAGLDVVLPRRSTAHDSLGRTIRDRFGDEVLERLVDPLVGSINAGDSDHLSLRASTPQIAPVAERSRSLLLGLRKVPTPGPGAGPVFLTPRAGIAEFARRLVAQLPGRGVELRTGRAIGRLDRDGAGFRVDDEPFDAVILACPTFVAAELLGELARDAALGLGGIASAGVSMVTVRIDDRRFLGALPSGSGYLVPKPEQLHVTAVSFASRKWSHLQPPAGGEVLRVSLGRLGNQAPLDFDDETAAIVVAKELSQHLGVPAPEIAEVRVTRWPRAFPQYGPGHLDRVDAIERAVATLGGGISVAGAGMRGVGIPACIRQGTEAADATNTHLASLTQ